MKQYGLTEPVGFEVIQNGDWADIIFREGISPAVYSDEQGEDQNGYSWYEWHLTRRWYDNLEKDIRNNYEPWITAAKMEENMSRPVDIYQLKADLEFMETTSNGMMGISLLSEGATDTAVVDKAYQYYPTRWDEPRLRMLVALSKISADDFEKITGKTYEAEVAG